MYYTNVQRIVLKELINHKLIYRQNFTRCGFRAIKRDNLSPSLVSKKTKLDQRFFRPPWLFLEFEIFWITVETSIEPTESLCRLSQLFLLYAASCNVLIITGISGIHSQISPIRSYLDIATLLFSFIRKVLTLLLNVYMQGV